MATPLSRSDNALKNRLTGLSQTNKDYWSFKKGSHRGHSHGFFQYPAMTVPQVVSSILGEIFHVHPAIKRVGDPFVGSGTVLTESMLQGLDFSGIDINPLSVLLCQVKTGPFFVARLDEKVADLFKRIGNDTAQTVDVNFPNIDKWFQPNVQIELSKIRRAILIEDSLWARRFFWIGMAEAVRLTCNSRTSTFKLHIRPRSEITKRNCDAKEVFKRAILRNVGFMKDQARYLKKKGFLNRGHYTGNVEIKLGDTRKTKQEQLCDLIITSPPYGDNTTTVPYGQYSYLPLQWIELSDIATSANASFLSSTHEIDFQSLGGSKKIEDEAIEALKKRSPRFEAFIDELNDKPIDRTKRVASFFRDLDFCLSPIRDCLRPGGIIVWILGNRKVGGKRVPLDAIVSELAAEYAIEKVCEFNRKIFSKRMALKNSIAETISDEVILVMRKSFGYE